MILEFDTYIDQVPYPNLARHQARPYTAAWRQFSTVWPFSEPVVLLDYLEQDAIKVSHCQERWYIIALSYFDFSIDWFELMPLYRKTQLQQAEIMLVFYYSEGDNPMRIRHHLENQCINNSVPIEQLRLISANSSADLMPNCAWFADDEMLYRLRNKNITALQFHQRPRKKLFTALVRTHKWWRAATMSELWRQGWHKHGFFSYNTLIDIGEPKTNNPLELDSIYGLESSMNLFLKQKFTADNLTSDQHNNHHLCVQEHFLDSYLNVVLETHMDVDQSHGVFITEKTFKPIKHAQPFVIFGAAHTLKKLQDLGYKTFDSVIDNSYDSIENTTQRWICLISILNHMFSQGPVYMHQVLSACKDDLLHNQKIFLQNKQGRIQFLLDKLSCK